uniref:Uncharacterized protein n=1 Tax=Siphoviridae sp. ct1TR2 TaxID=2825309 RepID=A0A8S5NTL2_9CAUD|nr:MAG TPA: hypothetical protein [Siphoviridae sp. ct1TR2]
MDTLSYLNSWTLVHGVSHLCLTSRIRHRLLLQVIMLSASQREECFTHLIMRVNTFTVLMLQRVGRNRRML